MMLTIAQTFDEHWKPELGPLETACHIWQRRISVGYGKIGSDWAHRVAWEREHGPIPDDMCVLHRCDVPACVNVEHLFLGTKADNIRDAAAKGRTCQGDRWFKAHGDSIARGSKHGRSELVEADIERIQDLRRAGCTHAEVAEWLNVSRSLVSLILAGKLWAHLYRPIPCPNFRGGSGAKRGAGRFRNA